MRYYGGKEKLLNLIETGVKETELVNGVCFADLFTGSTVKGDLDYQNAITSGQI